MKAGFSIGIVGPESTGKSALSTELAQKYGVARVPEVARDFLENLNRPYREEDLLHLAHLQLKAEQDVLKTNPTVLICDTTLLVIRIWSQFKYKRCHPEILKLEEERQYDLFLLTDIDLAWEVDPLREHPDRRGELFGWYYRALLEKNTPFSIIRGHGIERTQNAIRTIERRSERCS
jgi:nicotinamide riboside kinase